MRRIALLALFISYALYGIAQTKTPIAVQHIPASPQIASPTRDRLSSSLIPKMMPFAAPLVVGTPEITNTLVLANAASVKESATITVFSAIGKIITSSHITLQPHEKMEYPLSSLLSAANSADMWGSVTVEQDPSNKGTAVVGQVIVTDSRASTPAYIDEELAMPEMEGSAKLAAVTDQSEGPPLVAITNLSSETQHVSVTCLQAGKSSVSSSVVVTAHATVRSEACSNALPSTFSEYTTSLKEAGSPGVYGVELDSDGAPGSLAAFALAPHYRGHDLIFSSVPFYDPGTIHSSDVVFAGVPIGAQETLPTGVYIPRISLANFSSNPSTFSIYFADTRITPAKDANGNSQPPQLDMIHTITAPPHQTMEYVFTGQEAQSGLLHSVIVSTKGIPGTYQAKLVSRSTGTLYQVELLAKETLEMNNSGVHPWTVQGDTESHIVLFNHSKSDKKVGIFINAGSTTLWSSETVLAASETREVSINKLLKDQIPDDHGRLLPLTAKEGVVDWMSPESGDVTGRLMVTSRTAAMARNFSCGTYKSECELSLSTFYNDIGEGDTLEMYEANAEICINSQPLQCSNATSTNGTVNYNWNVGATSIITLNASTEQTKPSPMLLGVSGGSGTATVTASAGACQSSGTGYPTVQVPDHLEVLSDTTATVSCSAGTQPSRTILYAINDANNNPLTSVTLIRENVPTTTSSCTNSIVSTGSSCFLNNQVQPGGLNNFDDFLFPGCQQASAPNPCGFVFSNQQWQWCSTTGNKSIGTVGYDSVGSGIISIDGNIIGMAPGTIIRP